MEGLEIYTVELYLKVRLACADGMSKRAAARHFNISRDTVDKAMAFSIPPGYRRTAPVKRPKLDGFTEIIDSWLDGDKDVHRKQHHTAKRVFDRLRAEHGFTGGYTIIKDGGRSPPPVRGQGRRFGCGNGGAGRCSFRWPIRRGRPKRISAKPTW